VPRETNHWDDLAAVWGAGAARVTLWFVGFEVNFEFLITPWRRRISPL